MKRPGARRANSFGGMSNRVLEEEDVQMDGVASGSGAGLGTGSGSGMQRQGGREDVHRHGPMRMTGPSAQLSDLDSPWGR